MRRVLLISTALVLVAALALAAYAAFTYRVATLSALKGTYLSPGGPAFAILAAIIARDRTGVGQHIDISMLDVQISMLTYISTMQMMSGLKDTPVRGLLFQLLIRE